MKKLFYAIFLIIFSLSITQAQKTIVGTSNSKVLDIKPQYSRTLPPKLYGYLNFQDNNKNGLLEAKESAQIELEIINRGDGPAQGLKIEIRDSINDSNLEILNNSNEIGYLQAGKSIIISIPIRAGLNIKTAEHKIQINVYEHFGYDMDPAFLILNTLEYQKPEVVFSGIEIYDTGKGTSTVLADGLLQPGEFAKAKIIIQNIGQNIAYSSRYKIHSGNSNIFIEKKTDTIGDIVIGETKEIWISISPNKRIEMDGILPIFLTVNVAENIGDLKDFQLPLSLNQKPPKPILLEVKVDIENIKKKVARFEYKSNRFTANIGELKDIHNIPELKTKRPNSVAVIFGIENYAHLAPAPYAENDADLIKQYFQNRLGIEQVVIYKSHDAKGFVFDDVFNPKYGELQKAIIKGKSDLFVFYSGHGLPSKSGDNVYLFPSDGKIERIDVQGYSLDNFYKNLESLNARSTTVFLDACFSGASKTSENYKIENLVSMKGVKIKPKYEQPWLTNPNFTVFNSSSGEQTSLGFDAAGTGLFTYYLCAGLLGDADGNGDKKITSGELGKYIQNNVEVISQKLWGLQSPQMHGNKDMILLEY